MCKYSVASLTLLTCLFASLASAASNPAAPITDVTLFPGGATIVRTVQLARGMTQAVIADLPARFDMQTLRAEAGAGIHIGDIVSADAAKTHAVNPAEAELEAKIAALQDQQAVLDADAKSAQMVVDYLGRLGGSDTAAPDARRPAPMDAKALSALLNTMGTEAGKALARIQRVSLQQRELSKKIEALQRDLARLRSGTRDTRTLTINLSAEQAGVLSVSYQVNNAGWKPAYRASLNSATSALELERMATISQRTGEDWSNVRLTLSTGQPRQATSGSDPRPWLLSYRLPRPLLADSYAPMMAEAPEPVLRMKKSLASLDKAEAKEEGEAAYLPPTFETQNMFSTEFKVQARTSLPADGREVSVALGKQSIAAKQYLQSTPRQEAAVYVTAEADKPQGDWPAGNMQLFRDGSYVGSSWWNPQARDRLVLGFGRDEQIHVAIIPLKSDSGSGGIFGKRKQKKIATDYSFANHHQRAVSLLVLEASPVATADEVRVLTAFDPKPGRESWEDKRGVMAWEINLAPGKTSKIRTEYEIEFPGEGELVEQR